MSQAHENPPTSHKAAWLQGGGISQGSLKRMNTQIEYKLTMLNSI